MTNDQGISRLLQPARLGPLQLPNRLVMAPMSRTRAAADGTPTPLMATYYAQRASAGLIIAEGTTPNAVGQTYPNIPAIHTAGHIDGWRRVNDAVHAAGGRSFLQLQHGGRNGHPETSGLLPVAPSPIALPEEIHTPNGRQPSVVPHALTTAEIAQTVEDFAQAARNAIAAGFAGVEVHAANGHLLHQFMSQNTNHRTDAYGGSFTARNRFPAEVISAVTAAIGPERVGLRISPRNTVNGIEEGDTDRIYQTLIDSIAGSGLAYVHLVFADPEDHVYQRIREQWQGTLIANPSLPWPGPFPADGGLGEAGRLLGAGADLIALGRAFIANPDLVERIRLCAPLTELSGTEFMYVGGETGYSDYPTLSSAA